MASDDYSQTSNRIIPYLCVDGAADAIEFYRNAFGATEIIRMPYPDGKIGHAEMAINAERFMLADEFPDFGFKSPTTLGGSPVTLHMYVDDVDSFVTRAVEAGASLDRPVADQFYGDRGGRLVDPFGHIWWIATRKESISVDEMKRRAEGAYDSE